jgi:hypothetical protein
MIFLIRPPDIAACEDERHAARYLAQGYERVEKWRFVYYWSLRDYQDFTRLRAVLSPSKGGPVPARERVVGVPMGGWAEHIFKQKRSEG